MLVHGLKDPKVHSVGDWRELLTDVLLCDWPAPDPYEDTRKAEVGLGIEGTPYYFYAMRTHEAFDFVVFVAEETGNEGSVTDRGQGGATPFDSGGLWKGKIHPLNGAKVAQHVIDERRRVFAANNVALDRWQPEFREYLEENYDDILSYVQGQPPSQGTDPITNADPNTERAWTWEVRYPTALIAKNLRLRYVCMHPHDLADYVNWLPSCLGKLGAAELAELTDWVTSNVEVSDSPSDAVESMLQRLTR